MGGFSPQASLWVITAINYIEKNDILNIEKYRKEYFFMASTGAEVYHLATAYMNQSLVVLQNFLKELSALKITDIQEKATTNMLIKHLDNFSGKLDEKMMQTFMDELSKNKYAAIREPILSGLTEYVENQKNFRAAVDLMRENTKTLGLTPSQQEDLNILLDISEEKARTQIAPFAPAFKMHPSVVDAVTQHLAREGIPFSVHYAQGSSSPYLITTQQCADTVETVIKYESTMDRANNLMFDSKEEFERKVNAIHIIDQTKQISPQITCVKNIGEKEATIFREKFSEKTKFPVAVEKDLGSGTYSIYFRKQDQGIFNKVYLNTMMELSGPSHELFTEFYRQEAENHKEIQKVVESLETEDPMTGYIINTRNPEQMIEIHEDSYTFRDIDGQTRDMMKPEGLGVTPDNLKLYSDSLKDTSWFLGENTIFIPEKDAENLGMAELSDGVISDEFRKYVKNKTPHVSMTKGDIAFHKISERLVNWIGGSERFKGMEPTDIMRDFVNDPQEFINELKNEQVEKNLENPEAIEAINGFYNEMTTDSHIRTFKNMAQNMLRTAQNHIMYPEMAEMNFTPPDPGTDLLPDAVLNLEKLKMELALNINIQLKGMGGSEERKDVPDKTMPGKEHYENLYASKVEDLTEKLSKSGKARVSRSQIDDLARSSIIMQNSLDFLSGKTDYMSPGTEYAVFIMEKAFVSDERFEVTDPDKVGEYIKEHGKDPAIREIINRTSEKIIEDLQVDRVKEKGR